MRAKIDHKAFAPDLHHHECRVMAEAGPGNQRFADGCPVRVMSVQAIAAECGREAEKRHSRSRAGIVAATGVRRHPEIGVASKNESKENPPDDQLYVISGSGGVVRTRMTYEHVTQVAQLRRRGLRDSIWSRRRH